MKIEKKHLFNLNNGSTLTFATHWQRGPINNWYLSHNDKRVWESSNGPKDKLFKADLWSSRTSLDVICADFDNVPRGFADYDSLYDYFKTIFSSEEAIVARSASGKVKCFFLVETGASEMTTSIAKDTLEKIFQFNDELYPALDLSQSGMRITYLNYHVIIALSSGLTFLKPLAVVEDSSLMQRTVVYTSSPTAKLRQYAGSLKELFPNHTFKGAREGLLRILLESRELLTAVGFGISLKKISKDLDRSFQRVGIAKKYFLKINWLELVDDHYIPGKKAKSYIASGKLREALLQRLGSYSPANIVPLYIPDGAWNSTLRNLMGRLHRRYTLEQVLEKIRKIRGAEIGDRLTQAKNLYNWYKKNEFNPQFKRKKLL